MKIPLKNNGEMKTFSKKKKPKGGEFVVSKPALTTQNVKGNS